MKPHDGLDASLCAVLEVGQCDRKPLIQLLGQHATQQNGERPLDGGSPGVPVPGVPSSDILVDLEDALRMSLNDNGVLDLHTKAMAARSGLT